MGYKSGKDMLFAGAYAINLEIIGIAKNFF